MSFLHNPARRRFVQGLASGGAAAAFGPAVAGATTGSPAAGAIGPSGLPELHGPHIRLDIGRTPVNFTGRERMATTINGGVPGPLLRWREGDTVTLDVTNNLAQHTSIHWHGILLPANMDGVPGMSFVGILPGATFRYRFTVRQSGTYWYHSHSGFQEQLGHYGPLVIEPREPDPHRADRDYVVMLSDWTDEDPYHVFATLKKVSDYYNFDQYTLGDLFRDVRQNGLIATMQERAMWGEMRMMATDLADVSAHTYTYLMNGQAPAGNWTGLFKPGETVRLRFINGAAMSFFDVRIPGLEMTVIAADGQPVHPVSVDEFRIAVAETIDVLVRPRDGAYTIFAQSSDRTGYARGTLAPRAGMEAAVPELDPRPMLMMADMGHGGHGGHGGGGGGGGGGGHEMPAMSHGGAIPRAGKSSDAHVAGGGAEHAGHAAASGGHEHAGHGAMKRPAGQADAAHTGHGDGHAAGMPAVHGLGTLRHAPSEYGNPGVDMLTMTPKPKLDDPGIGLRNNGRRVLTYADMRTTFADPDGRPPSREIELHLTGHMERYVWSFDGIRFADSEPLRLRYGERVMITLVNDTMMEHPVHLHGVWSDVVDENGDFMLRKHTVTMPPGTRRSYLVTADALGRWAYHCHLLYHMEAGMMREVRIDV